MDRTAFFVVTICVILLYLTWPNLQSPSQERVGRTNSIDSPLIVNSTNKVTSPTNINLQSSNTSRTPVKLESEKLISLKTENSTYTFTSAGGLKSIGLNNHKLEPCSSTNNNTTIQLNHASKLPLFALDGIDDSEFFIQNDDNWLTMSSTNQAGILITKKFTPLTNHLLQTSIKLENTTDKTISLNSRTLNLGTSTPLNEPNLRSIWGVQFFDGESMQEIDEAWFSNKTLGCFPGTPRSFFTSNPLTGIQSNNWIGIHNRFFSVVTMPMQELKGAAAQSQQTSTEKADLLDGQYVHSTGISASFRLASIELKSGESIEQEFTTYAGPKEYRSLVQIGISYNNSLHSIMDLDGFFGFFSRILLRSMNGLNSWGLSYALSIIAITIIIKLIFYPLTKNSTLSMKRMSAFQPQMKEIREKYKADPQKMNKKTMEFMKENKINPVGSCLPVVIQMPIFLGYFFMLQSAIELRGAEFLWACDLSQADTIATIAGIPINPLPILMSITMWLQMRMNPTSPSMDQMAQKMMQFMPLMILVMCYSFPSGLALYWTASNILGIFQTKMVRDIKFEIPNATPANSALAKPIKVKNKRKK